MKADAQLCDYREQIVEALVLATGLDPDDVEDTFMPAVDNGIRAELGHDKWIEWVR